MKKVMLKREYGDVFDYGWATVVWIKERKEEKLLKMKNKSEKKKLLLTETAQTMKYFYNASEQGLCNLL